MMKRLWTEQRNACLLTLALLVISIVASPWILLAAVLPVGWVLLNKTSKAEDQPLTTTEKSETMSELPTAWQSLNEEEMYERLNEENVAPNLKKITIRFCFNKVADDGGEISYSDFDIEEKQNIASCMFLNLCFDPEINGWDDNEVQILKVLINYNGITKISGYDFGYELTSEGLIGYPAPIVTFELNKEVDKNDFRRTIFESSVSIITKKMKGLNSEPFIAEDHNGYTDAISEEELEECLINCGSAALIPPREFLFPEGMPQYGHLIPLTDLI